jgi:hypothetical protein
VRYPAARPGMAALLEQDARYSYYGRTVGLVGPEDGDIDQLATLAMVQGNTNYGAVPSSQVAAVKAGLQARGLVPMQYDKWEGVGSPVAAARHALATTSLPEDLTLVRLEASTPDQLMASMAKMALDCGVLPLCGEVLRGLYRPAVSLVALDRESNVVACAASCAFAHLEHPGYGKQAWWGMLATHPARRGHRLSLILGSHVLLDMETRFGVSGVHDRRGTRQRAIRIYLRPDRTFAWGFCSHRMHRSAGARRRTNDKVVSLVSSPNGDGRMAAWPIVLS